MELTSYDRDANFQLFRNNFRGLVGDWASFVMLSDMALVYFE